MKTGKNKMPTKKELQDHIAREKAHIWHEKNKPNKKDHQYNEMAGPAWTYPCEVTGVCYADRGCTGCKDKKSKVVDLKNKINKKGEKK